VELIKKLVENGGRGAAGDVEEGGGMTKRGFPWIQILLRTVFWFAQENPPTEGTGTPASMQCQGLALG